jgi:hypothetical protein
MRGVLNGVEADEPHTLTEEVITAQTHREEVMVSGIPADGGDVLLALLFVGETPNRQLVTFVFEGIKGFPVGPVVFIIVILFFLVVLHHHTLHNLELFLETGGVETGTLDIHLEFALLVFLVLLLEFRHVSVEDLPLVHLKVELNGNGRLSAHTYH